MKNTILIITVMFLLTFCAQPEKKKETAYFQNPVIAGDFPDPSVIRVGDTYYAAGTSCDFAPNYPLFESKDLINWKRIGSVFNEPPAWTADDFWAPELFYHNGTFFVYYTTKRKDNRIACIGVATTKDISKGFTDHGILIEWGEEAIDAFVFQDDDEKLYITWKAYGLTPGRDIEILCSELSDDGMQLVGDHFTLTDFTKGWQGAGDEGQCIVKRNGWYYMFYSVGGCCDNRCDYRVRVARSKNLRNGWEQFPEPIIQGGDEWRCTGHGTLVTTPDNRYFYMYHSYNATDFEYIGRQGMLSEVLWNDETGWPYFKYNTPALKAEVPFENTHQVTDSVFVDDFSDEQNLAFWSWEVNHKKPGIEVKDGQLVLTANEAGVGFLGLRPKSGNYQFSSEVIQNEAKSGIGIYSNRQNMIALVVNRHQLELFHVNNGAKEVLATAELENAGSVYLKYEAINARYFQFFWSLDGKEWMPVETTSGLQVDGSFIAQWGYAPRAGFIFGEHTGSSFAYNEIRVKYN